MVTAPPPPRTLANAGRLKPESAPAPAEAPKNLSTSNQGKWVPLTFKVTEDERYAYRLEAAKRRMNLKELFEAALKTYREQYPLQE
ncbi:hypothetical protein [Methylorubrum extorquens]|uniref:hypothetical protein n=1 Tax=Methylorubrum extorquens TaxID=408 RepID=UPI0020A169BE|nr:hypothetical protein [Methylorubrum extorquens]MCP1540087.1 hypothetical protein [Methylorubrum extorquens]